MVSSDGATVPRSRTMSSPLLLVLLLTLQLSPTGSTLLTIHNNKYDNLVVAIHDSVPENLTIISEMKSILTDASWALYEATRRRSYIGSVMFLVPGTWSKQSAWGTAKDETFEEADIRIDHPSPVYGDNPYTEQPAGCRAPGKFIHLTPKYVLNTQYRQINWGQGGRTLVHEFAHLRYGVFDEYGLGNSDFPDFYLDDGNLMPTGCTDSIKGQLQGDCSIDPKTQLPGKDCYFLSDADGNTARASIMNDVFINSVTTFCESNTNDPDYLHNDLAPNLHNKMCGGKGTWDIILESPDFRGGANPPVNKTKAETRPTFNVLYNAKTTTHTGAEVCGRPVVLVLDVSGSMLSNNRFFKQGQTADKFIRDILPVGTKVGVVTFSSTPSTTIPLTVLSTTTDRDSVSKRLPQRSDYRGSTGIGRGLLLAKQMLEDDGALKEGRIVLITDGEENVRPFVAEMKGELLQAGVRVHAVAYSSAAARAIGKLANESGGQYAYYSEGANSTVLDSVIETLMKDISICNNRVRIEVVRVAKFLPSGTTVEDNVIMDATVGNDTLFVFTLPRGVSVTVTLTSPDGVRYNSGSDEYSFDPTLYIVRFNFRKAQTGVWRYSLRSFTSGTVTLVVKALPADHAQPYVINSWLSSTGADLSAPNPTAPIVYVSVRKGYSPVMDADVTVIVERPSGPPVTLKPMDKGALPDNMADDGVYSGYFTQFSGNDRYSLDVDVRTIAHKTRYFLQGGPAFGRANSRYHNTPPPVKSVLAENFTRPTSAGAMDVDGFVEGKDIFAPSRVTDLKVIAFNTRNSTVTLTWTAPGDDLNVGTASRYEIRIAETVEALRDDFSSCLMVTPLMIMSGHLAPRPANSREEITIKIPVGWTTVVFAMLTFDGVNHQSDKSNTAVATYKQVKLPGHAPTTQQTRRSVTPSPMQANTISTVVIGAIVGDTPPPVKSVLAENFTRPTSAGAMDVDGFVERKDIYAPNRVTDLKVIAFNTRNSTVTLTWTAPGDDLNVGTASRYEIRIAETVEALRNDFTSCLMVTPRMIMSGHLAPRPANSREEIMIKIPVGWTTVGFAMLTFDEVNHQSDKSNTVVALFKHVQPPGHDPTTQQTTRRSVTPSPMQANTISTVVIGAIVGDTPPPVKSVLAENFTRPTSAGAMDVDGFVERKDIYAPNRVTDLKVIAFNTRNSTVTLTWTAPGDDLNVGTASRYEIRIAETVEALRDDFTSCLMVTPLMIMSGHLAPRPANSREEITIKIPVGWTTVVFALLTLDEVNHQSDKSYTVVALFKQVKLPDHAPTTQQTTRRSVTSSPMQANTISTVVIGAIVGGTLGGVVIGAAVAVAVAKMVIKKKILHMPSNPLDTEMTKPCVPHESFFLNMKS